MILTNDELEAIYDVIYNEAYYGDDEVVYGNGAHAVALRRALTKVEDERKRRKL